MAVIGFHFKKMSVEKKKAATGKINVNNNITMLEVKEAKVNMGNAKQKGVEFSFHFKAQLYILVKKKKSKNVLTNGRKKRSYQMTCLKKFIILY